MVFEVPGVDEAADVMGEVAECQGDAEQVLQASDDCLGGAVDGTREVKVGQVVSSSFGQSPGQRLAFLEPVWGGLF